MIWIILLGPILYVVGVLLRDGNMDSLTTGIGRFMIALAWIVFAVDIIAIAIGAFSK